MVLARPVGVLTELHVQDPMLAVLAIPMTPYCFRKPRPIAERAQIVSAFCRGFVTHLTARFHPAHGLQAGPLRLLWQPLDSVTQDIAPGLEASMILFHGLLRE